jgi:putative Mg2+ transporter-C (MgtC) family protein
MPSDLLIAARLVVATSLAGAVGLERERADRGAGLRTHALVGLGSCLVMVVSAFGFADWSYSPGSLDPSRIAAQVVSGIGFLGAGVIIFQRERNAVRGLTTAASVWLVAGIGLAAGGGMYLTALAATAIGLVVLAGLRPLERLVSGNDERTHLGLELDSRVLPVRDVVQKVQEVGLHVEGVQLRPGTRPHYEDLDLVYSDEAEPRTMAELAEHLREVPGVYGLRTGHLRDRAG